MFPLPTLKVKDETLDLNVKAVMRNNSKENSLN